MAKQAGAVGVWNLFHILSHRTGKASPAQRRDGPAEDGEDAPAPSRWLDRLAQGSTQFRAIIVDSIVGFTLVIGVATVVLEVFRDSAVIDPIQVPDGLAAEGYRPEVISQRLMDEVLEIRRVAASLREGREIQPEGQELNIELPGTGVSLASLVRIVKRFLGASESRVAGEIVVHEGQYVLRLRFRGHGLHAEVPARSRADLDELLRLGAREMMKVSEPYILAAYLSDFDSEAALKAIVLSLDNDLEDDDPWALTLWGWLLTSEGRHDEAIEKYRAALAKKRDFILAAANWGITLARKGEYDKAIEQYRRALWWNSNFHVALNNWGVALMEKGEPKAAIEKYRQALRIAPRYVRAYNHWGAALSKLGQHDEALKIYAKALDIDPWNAVSHRNLGHTLLAKKENLDAEEKLRRAAELDPKGAETFLYWGISFSRLGQYREAISRFETSVKLNPDLVLAYNSWGIAFQKLKRYPAAAKMYWKATNVDPGYAPARRKLGNVLLRRKDYEGAICQFKRAIEIDPKHARTYKSLGDVLWLNDDLVGAIEKYKKAIEFEPNYKKAHDNLSKAQKGKSNLERAIEEYKETIKANSQQTDAYVSLGSAYSELGSWEAAIEYLQLAIGIDPEGNWQLGGEVQRLKELAEQKNSNSPCKLHWRPGRPPDR